MIFIASITVFLLVIIFYSKYRNKIWIWQEIYLNISGIRVEGKIIDVYISKNTIVENHVAHHTYVMAIEYSSGTELFRTKVIVTDSFQNGRYEKGNNLFIIHSKNNEGIAILDRSKYRFKNENNIDKDNEQRINDIINKN